MYLPRSVADFQDLHEEYANSELKGVGLEIRLLSGTEGSEESFRSQIPRIAHG